MLLVDCRIFGRKTGFPLILKCFIAGLDRFLPFRDRSNRRTNPVQIYLPIADLPVNIFLILGMGLAVGFISGMFGIGGGFLMTPLLIFPRRFAGGGGGDRLQSYRRILMLRGDQLLAAADDRRAARRLAAGRRHCRHRLRGVAVHDAALDRQLDITIGLSYVLLLGGDRLPDGDRERARDHARAQGKPIELRRPGSHTWIHGLPLKLRFKRSRIYVSAIPVLAIGLHHRLRRRRHGHRRRISAGAELIYIYGCRP